MATGGTDTATRPRVSVSVWLSITAHVQLRQQVAAGASLPVLARVSAAAGVAAPGGRVGMLAPEDAAVERLRDTGYRLNRLVAALNEGLAGTATVAQHRAVAARIAPLLVEIGQAAHGVRLRPPVHRPLAAANDEVVSSEGSGWRLVRVTTDPATALRWEQAAAVAGFRSVANWIRDAMAGVYGLAIPRPPALATIQARTVVGRVSGLVAQVELAASEVAVIDRVCSGPAETAGTELANCLESLVLFGGDVKARR